MPGFTHLQNAQPVLFSHYLLSLFEMFQRDKKRVRNLQENLNECPLGSGALVGTNFFEIDRFSLAKDLGFKNHLRIRLTVYLIEILFLNFYS